MEIYYCFYKEDIEKQKEKAGHQAAYALLSYVLEKKYGIFRLPKIEKGRYGKPYFIDYPQIHFNISHCDGMAACVTAEYEVGIDVEKKRRVSQTLVNKVLTEKEREELQKLERKDFEMGFLQYWTLKESFIKAIGRGLSFPLCDVEFYLKQNQMFGDLLPSLEIQTCRSFELERQEHIVLSAGSLSFTDQNRISSNQNDWQFFQTFLQESYLLSVCFPEFKHLN